MIQILVIEYQNKITAPRFNRYSLLVYYQIMMNVSNYFSEYLYSQIRVRIICIKKRDISNLMEKLVGWKSTPSPYVVVVCGKEYEL